MAVIRLPVSCFVPLLLGTSISRYVANKKYAVVLHATIIPIAPADPAVLSERNGTIRPSYRLRVHARTDPDKIREALFFGGIAASITSSQRSSVVRNVSRRLFL